MILHYKALQCTTKPAKVPQELSVDYDVEGQLVRKYTDRILPRLPQFNLAANHSLWCHSIRAHIPWYPGDCDQGVQTPAWNAVC